MLDVTCAASQAAGGTTVCASTATFAIRLGALCWWRWRRWWRWWRWWRRTTPVANIVENILFPSNKIETLGLNGLAWCSSPGAIVVVVHDVLATITPNAGSPAFCLDRSIMCLVPVIPARSVCLGARTAPFAIVELYVLFGSPTSTPETHQSTHTSVETHQASMSSTHLVSVARSLVDPQL